MRIPRTTVSQKCLFFPALDHICEYKYELFSTCASTRTMLSSAAFVLLLSNIAAAQYGYGGGGASTPTTTQAVAVPIPSAPADSPGKHNINVAAGGNFVFDPPTINATKGDTVTFWFPSGIQHSVTQSSFANPCTYLAASSNTSAGFDSGLTAGTQFTITIEDDTKPIWFHCKQITHCGLGMVGSINPTANLTQDAFVAAAKAIGSNEKAESDAGFVSGGANALASAAPSNTGVGPTPSTAPSSSMGKPSLSMGAVILSLALAMFSLWTITMFKQLSAPFRLPDSDKLGFRTSPGGIAKLVSVRNISETDSYWNQYTILFDSPSDVFSLITPHDIRRALAEAPENIATLVRFIIARLSTLISDHTFPTPPNASVAAFASSLIPGTSSSSERNTTTQVLNCLRILQRVLPIVFEVDGETSPFELELFWKREPAPESTPLEASQFVIQDEDDSDNETREATQPVSINKPSPSLAERLFDTLIDLMFCYGFTLPSKTHAEPHKIAHIIWETGIGSTSDLGPNHALDNNKTEVLRLLLVLLSRQIYVSPASLLSKPSEYTIHMVQRTPRRDVLTILCSLLNTAMNSPQATSMNLAGMAGRLPYNHLVFKGEDSRSNLVGICLQVLCVLLDFQSGSCRDRPIATDDLNGSAPAARSNSFRYFLMKLHRTQDFGFVADGIMGILEQQMATMNILLPGAKKPVPYINETVILFWKMIELNKKFRAFLFESDRGMDIIGYLLCYALEIKDKPHQHGLCRALSYIVQTLSAEPGFGPRLLKTIKAQTGTKWNVPGTAADFIIHAIYSMVATTSGQLNALYPALIIALSNSAPYFKNLTVTASTRLLQLFTSFSNALFLLSDEGHPRLLFFMLEVFNAVILHNLRDNANLIYGILSAHQVFEDLGTFTLSRGLRRVQLAKEEQTRSAAIKGKGPQRREDDPTEKIKVSQEDSPPPSLAQEPQRPTESSTSETEPTSEKARGKMRERRSQSLDTNSSADRIAAAGVGRNGFVPSQEWVTSWQQGLPLDAVMLLISELLPKVQEMQTSRHRATSTSAIVEYLGTISLADVLPPVPPIMPRRFLWSDASIVWLTSLIWGEIYVKAMAPLGLWNATNVRLFYVKHAPSQQRQLTEAVSNVVGGLLGRSAPVETLTPTSGYPGIPPGPDRPQAAVKGAIEVRTGPQGAKAKWVRIELRKVETLPGGGVVNTFHDFVGPSPVNLWTSSEEYGLLRSQDFPFSIRIPESIPPSIDLQNKAGISYELVASVCTKGKKGFLRKRKSVVVSTQADILIDKHELHSTWPVYCQLESRNMTSEGVTLIVERNATCYGPGDKISIFATVKSDALHTVILRGFELTLKESTVYRAGPYASGKKSAPQVRVLTISENKLAVNATLYGGTQHRAELACMISPDHTTTTLNAARHIDINYTLSVKALMGTGTPLIMDLPLIISNWQRTVSMEAIRRIGPVPSLSLFSPNSPRRDDTQPQTFSGRDNRPTVSTNAYNTMPVTQSLPVDDFGYTKKHKTTNSRSSEEDATRSGSSRRPGSADRNRLTITNGLDNGRRPKETKPSSAWPTAEEEKQRLYENAKIRVHETQKAAAQSSGPAQPVPATTPPRRGDASSNRWPTAEEEKLRLYNDAQEAVTRTQGTGFYSDTNQAGASSHGRSLSNDASDNYRPAEPKPTAAKVPQYMTAEQEKAALRRYHEAKEAVGRVQGYSNDGSAPSASSPIAYDSLFPGQQIAASGSGVNGQTDSPPPFEAGANSQMSALSEKERLRRAYAAQDAATVEAPPPFSGLSEKEIIQRKFDAQDAQARQNTGAPSPPPRTMSPVGRPKPAPPAGSRILTAAEEKALLKAKYDAENASTPLTNGNAVHTNGGGLSSPSSSVSAPSTPPIPPPLMPRPPAEYIQETQEEDARVSRFVTTNTIPSIDEDPLPTSLSHSPSLVRKSTLTPGLDVAPFTPFTPGFDPKVPGPPPPLPPKPAE
ncbi:hypothetical protein MIND_01051100 [Mycena indigotica]|uniref:Blue (type 1) copper domain-containing protein n=1 Tax=Mycena indigotica TaxID=2126181 RepID=A0A8H6VX51_9AGAR|nr:uncharacterized protein MIND_01051100 [Mycena indigotica]KAF7295126.1 hypothetical protein MIND_01051100 [Mycena indigotica]